jgi:cold-inducible RNA-binding protein
MNIYVGNLSFRATDEDMINLFSEFGEVVSAKVIMDRESGRSRGFAFVEMANAEDGKAAIEGLDGQEHQGRNLRVNEAQPRGDRAERPRGGDRPRRDREY